MRLLQSILGGIIGSALGVAAYYGILNATQKPVPWGILIIGLLAGLGVRLVCGKNRSGMTGIIAATLALVGLLGFNYAQIAFAQQGSGPIIVDTSNLESDNGESGDERTTNDAVVDDGPTPAPEERNTSNPAPVTVSDVVSRPNLALAQTSQVDTIAMALTGLLAYLLGRGNAAKTTIANVSTSGDDDA